ncbi:MAG: HaeII family restriction endonuclease [Paludibacteraceae bacterium]
MQTKNLSRVEAKKALDNVIAKSRAHLYKPIQIAEILYHHRTDDKKWDLYDLESYRNTSKKWRDDISISLLGRVCTSSAKFQDNLFEANAIPPTVLAILGEENKRTNGAVEAYIYNKFTERHNQLAQALAICQNATPDTFYVKNFIDSFWNEKGLKRSIDKVYEIIVYALFSTLVEAMNVQVSVSVNEDALPILKEFEDFSKKVMCIDTSTPIQTNNAMVYRVGVTNAADRGLDMYANWGPAIQIKHLTLDPDLAENIVNSVSSDRLVIVCKDVEKKVITSLLTQIGWHTKIQSIITEENLVDWYEKALRGSFANLLAQKLLDALTEEISLEFPSVIQIPDTLQDRHYEKVNSTFWK